MPHPTKPEVVPEPLNLKKLETALPISQVSPTTNFNSEAGGDSGKKFFEINIEKCTADHTANKLDASEEIDQSKKEKCNLYILFPLLSVIGGSLIGPVNNFLACKEHYMLVQVWRYFSSCLIITAALPFWIAYKKYKGEPVSFFVFKDPQHKDLASEELPFLFKVKVISVTFLSQAMSAGWTFGMTWASLNIVQSHTYILTGLHGPFMLIFMMLMCQKTHYL